MTSTKPGGESRQIQTEENFYRTTDLKSENVKVLRDVKKAGKRVQDQGAEGDTATKQ